MTCRVRAILLYRFCPSVHLSVCLSVCLSILPTNAAVNIVILFPGSAGGIVLIFEPRRRYKIPRAALSAAALNTRGWKDLRFSTEIAVYLGHCHCDTDQWLP